MPRHNGSTIKTARRPQTSKGTRFDTKIATALSTITRDAASTSTIQTVNKIGF